MTIAECERRQLEDAQRIVELEAREKALLEQLRVARLRAELAEQSAGRAWRLSWPAAVITSRGADR